ncbi:hypothetical protein BJY01DRAFT_220273 [Aspergillus pseudoustus]|uniref:UDP-Glycosyltransferase/glycogen phosphorylase n=1 Tax=Aspergillus pseudoustus TaxID=1810923 RepID=A0ABR4JDL7_9EURO
MRPRVAPRLINVETETLKPPPLDIVIMVVDEDIEPFIYVAQRLLQDSHRVRIAAGTASETSAQIHDLDFFPISKEQVHYRNHANKGGRVIHHQHSTSPFETYSHCWRACIAPYNDDPRPFLADAIIATPTAHAHIHCAERLSIPLHIMSAIPQTPTKTFPHPHACFVLSEGVDVATLNILSYAMVQERTWYTLIEPINQFRQCVLGLMPISTTTAATLVMNHQVPHTYFCSKLLTSKPVDWSENQGISGYIFRDPGDSYRPTVELDSFLLSGGAPIYFMMHDNIDHVSEFLATMIQRAVLKLGYRVLLSKQWQQIATILDDPNVFVVDSMPSDWLLSKVSLIVHDGDPESTKLALQHGKPSIILAKTEEQRNLGLAIAKIGAGASPLALRALTTETLTQALTYCSRPDVQHAARAIQHQLIDEGGAESAVQSFYRWLPPAQKRVCAITQQDLAIFRVWNRSLLSVSAEAAAVLLAEEKISLRDLVLADRCVYDTQPEQTSSTNSTTKQYLTGLNNAVKDIVSASDLVGKLSRSRKREGTLGEDDSECNERGRPNPARDVGLGTARFFGNIALLPFTSTALVVNTAIYAVKGVHAHISNVDKKEKFATKASYDFPEHDSICAEPSISLQSIRGSIIMDTKTSPQQDSHMLNTTYSSSGQLAPKTGSNGSTTTMNQIQLRNDEHVLAIFQRYLDRGARSDRVQDTKFKHEVLDAF